MEILNIKNKEFHKFVNFRMIDRLRYELFSKLSTKESHGGDVSPA
jgi:hypothetical protein